MSGEKLSHEHVARKMGVGGGPRDPDATLRCHPSRQKIASTNPIHHSCHRPVLSIREAANRAHSNTDN